MPKMGIHRSRQDICKRTLRKVYDRRKDVRGLVAAALTETAASPASHADLPPRHAWANASAIREGLPAAAMAVFTRTASAPISRASAAWLGAPRPASTTTGAVACSMMILINSRVSTPLLVPMGAPRGMTAAAPASCRRLASTGSALM